MRHSYGSSVVLAIVLSAASGLAFANEDKKDDSAVTPAKFVANAAQAGMTEVELGKIALAKSQDEAVRKFADRMVKDHGKANAELAAIGKRKNLEVPKALDVKHREMVDELGKKSGREFDVAYAQHMVMDHDKAVGLFQKAATLPDAELAGFAKKTLPTIAEHKRMANELHSSQRTAAAGQKATRSQ